MTTATQNRTPRRKDGPAILGSGSVNKTRKGEIFDRTVPMTRLDAKRFAEAIAALPTFSDVRALSSKRRAEDGRTWFVRWHRSSAITLDTATTARQDIRLERALHQASEMEFFPIAGEIEDLHYCLHLYPDTADVPRENRGLYGLYVTHPSLDCTCPDYSIRLRGTCIRCKHMNALRMHLALPLVPDRPVSMFPDTPEGKVQRREWVRRNRDLDFA
jgi:hypothetical protein